MYDECEKTECFVYGNGSELAGTHQIKGTMPMLGKVRNRIEKTMK